MRMLRSVGMWAVAGMMVVAAAGVGWSQSSPSSPTARPGDISYSPDGDAGMGVGIAHPSSTQTNSGGTQSSPPPPSPSPKRSSLDQDTGPTSPEAVQARLRNADRQKQLVDDTAKLVSLANALKDEVDKSTKDELSLEVVRKADEIEKLAHNVKEKMKCSGCSGGPVLTP